MNDREAKGRRGRGGRESRKREGGKEAMNGDNRARGLRRKSRQSGREKEQKWIGKSAKDRDGQGGPVEFRARYAIWRYRGQRLVRNAKLFMNGRKLSLKL